MRHEPELLYLRWKVGRGLIAKLCLTLVTPWTAVCQVPLSMGFSRQEYWGGLPFPSPDCLPNPGIEPRSPALQENYLLTELPGNSKMEDYWVIYIVTRMCMVFRELARLSFQLAGRPWASCLRPVSLCFLIYMMK